LGVATLDLSPREIIERRDMIPQPRVESRRVLCHGREVTQKRLRLMLGSFSSQPKRDIQ